MKCGEQSKLYTRNNAFCNFHFSSLVEHKVKSNLRLKCEVLKEQILVAVSGGMASLLMAKVMHESIQVRVQLKKTKKK